MLSEKDIKEKLSEVIDPELGINIVDLGFIYEINVHSKEEGEDQKVDVKMTFTTPACPLINTMISQVEEKLGDFENADIRVDIVFDPPWTPERMSRRAKIRLGME